MADNTGWHAEAVLAALRSAVVEPQPPVTPVLCFLGAEWPLFGAPDELPRLRLERPRSIKRLLTTSTILHDVAAERITSVLSSALPPK